LTLAPFDSYLNYLWGTALLKQGNRTAAIPQLKFSLWCTDNIDSHLQLAQIYTDNQQLAEARVHIQQILTLDPKNKKALDMMEKIGD